MTATASWLGSWFGGIFSLGKTSYEEEQQEKELNAVRDAILLLKPIDSLGLVLTRRVGDNGTAGFVIWSNEEILLHQEFCTERRTRVFRASENELVLNDQIRIQVHPVVLDERPVTLMHGEVLAETARVVVELFTRRRIADGLHVFDQSKKGSYFRTITDLSEMIPEVSFSTSDECVRLERLLNGNVVFTLLASALHKHHHFLAAPGVPTFATPPSITPKQHPLQEQGGGQQWGFETPDSNATPVYRKPPIAMLSGELGAVDLKTEAMTPGDEENGVSSIGRRVNAVRRGMKLTISESAGVEAAAGATGAGTGTTTTTAAAAQPFSSGGAPPPPPPPPPPPLFTRSSELSPARKNVPQRKLRPLHWKGIQKSAEPTFWTSVPGSPDRLPLDVSEVELLFGVSPAKNAAAGAARRSRQRDGPLGLGLIISFKRANHCGIVLARIAREKGVDEIRRAIMELDQNLTLDQLRGLSSLFPLTDQEQKALSSCSADSLQGPERFFFDCLSVPRIQTRLAGCILQKTLVGEIRDIRRNITIVASACQELRNNVRFGKLLKWIFKLGLVLNRDSYLAKNTVGFSLTTLNRLGETKAKTTNLLSYLVTKCREQDSSLLDFVEDLPSLDYVCRISLTAVEDELRNLESGVAALETGIAEARTCRDDPYFLHRFSCFVGGAKISTQAERQELEATYRVFGETVCFYGEDPKEMKSVDEFFMIIKRFSDLLQKEKSCQELASKKNSRNK